MSRNLPAFEAMVTMVPRRRSIMPGRKDLRVRNVAPRLDSTTARHSSSLVSWRGVKVPKPPAKATSTSVGPSSLSTCSRMRSISVKRVQSALTPIAVPPASRRPATTRSMPPGSRAFTATLTRFAASIRQVAAPMPFDPPVTTATLPARSGKLGTGTAAVSTTALQPPWIPLSETKFLSRQLRRLCQGHGERESLQTS